MIENEMARTLRMLARGGRLIVCPRDSGSASWLTKETNKPHGSTIHCRGRSDAASAASDVPNPQKGYKRVSKEERRAMLVSYVNKYREANRGEFPSVSKAKDEVGGSFYTVRQIIQELKYQPELDPSTCGVKAPTRNEPRKIRQSTTEVEDSVTQLRLDPKAEDEAQSISSTDAMSTESLKDETTIVHGAVKPAAEANVADFVGTQSTIVRKDGEKIPPPERREYALREAQDDRPKLVSDQNHVKEETKEDLDRDKSTLGEARPKEPEGISDSDSTQKQEKQHQASPLVDKDTEPPRKSSLWGNLKSFADGIISIWRNR